jgi:hypothetical protein
MFGKLFGGAKRRTMRKSNKKSCKKCKKRSMKKGSPSKTRKGRKNFITHKGDKDYNARGHRQVKKHAPYMKKRGGGSCGSHKENPVPVGGGEHPTHSVNEVLNQTTGGKRRRSHKKRSHKKRSHRRRGH